MKIGAKLLLPLITSALLLLAPTNIYAHPGRTASDGCHYCRTNCASWGEVEGARHCHGGEVAPVTYSSPATPKPTPRPTVTPTQQPKPKPTTSPSPTPIDSVSQLSPTDKPQVLGVSDTAEDSNSTNIFSTLLGLGIFIGIPAWIIKRRREVTNKN